MSELSLTPPLVVHEDEHLLVVDKPAGWNTHAPAPHANEGIYDWLRHREPRWATLSILHRLDKETSGLMVFGKTPLANKSLTQQFTERQVEKEYRMLASRPAPPGGFESQQPIARAGERYVCRADGQPAHTRFQPTDRPGAVPGGAFELIAHPLTGRTHQIRVHAAQASLPILGDLLYGGAAGPRLFLHAARLAFTHPASGLPVEFRSIPDWLSVASDSTGILGAVPPTFIHPEETDSHRLVHGASDGWPGISIDRFGAYLLVQSEAELPPSRRLQLGQCVSTTPNPGRCIGVYHKRLLRNVRHTTPEQVSPEPIAGEAAPERFFIRENGLRFETSFQEGYSVGIFLDQRDNRRRWKTGHVAADFSLQTSAGPDTPRSLLNTFAYTCAFSVAAATGGWVTTSLDLSRKYLDWGRRNFELNGLDPARHDFIYGDTFDWLGRFAKKGRRFDAIILDPPTFSQSREHGRFRAESDYGSLVAAALKVLAPGGVLLASTNAARLEPDRFVAVVEEEVRLAGRRIRDRHYVPQPPDFPISREEPGYLKTFWVRLS